MDNSNFIWIIVPRPRQWAAILYWEGKADYRGESCSLIGAISLISMRQSYVLKQRELARSTRVDCPPELWPGIAE